MFLKVNFIKKNDNMINFILHITSVLDSKMALFHQKSGTLVL